MNRENRVKTRSLWIMRTQFLYQQVLLQDTIVYWLNFSPTLIYRVNVWFSAAFLQTFLLITSLSKLKNSSRFVKRWSNAPSGSCGYIKSFLIGYHGQINASQCRHVTTRIVHEGFRFCYRMRYKVYIHIYSFSSNSTASCERCSKWICNTYCWIWNCWRVWIKIFDGHETTRVFVIVSTVAAKT